MPEPRARSGATAVPRRAALLGGLAGAAGLALGGAAPAPARGEDEARALSDLVRAEQDAAFVHRAAKLDGAATFARHDEEHARALASHLEAIAMHVPGPTRGSGDLPPEALAVLEAPRGEARVRAALAYERSLLDGCLQRLDALEQPGTVRTAATVMASHAQHLVSLELINRR